MIRVKNNKKNRYLLNMDNFKSKKSVIVAIAAMLMSGVATTAHADIDNTATASGTYDSNTVTSSPDTASVPVADPTRKLLISAIGTPVVTKTSGALGDDNFTDAGDTVTFRYKVTNDGNITEDVTIQGAKPTFTPSGAGATAVDGTLSVSTTTEVPGHADATGSASALAPDEIAVFDVTYTMSDVDAFRAADVTDGIKFVATADAASISGVTDMLVVNALEATASIDPYTELSIQKVAYKGLVVAPENLVDASTTVVEGDKITYTYIVENLGNVPLSGVTITDNHEGVDLASGLITSEAIYATNPGVLGNTELGDAVATSDNDGVVELLAGGAEVILTYVHTVTQPEFDNQ